MSPPIAPGVTYAALGAACLLAWALAGRQAEHRPIAVLLTIGITSDLARRALRTLVLAPARAAGAVPFTGGHRVAAAAEVFLFLAWPAAIAAGAMIVYLGRRPWPVAVSWVLSSCALVAGYPTVRGALLGRLYAAAELAAVAAAVACVAIWYRSKVARRVGDAAGGDSTLRAWGPCVTQVALTIWNGDRQSSCTRSLTR